MFAHNSRMTDLGLRYLAVVALCVGAKTTDSTERLILESALSVESVYFRVGLEIIQSRVLLR